MAFGLFGFTVPRRASALRERMTLTGLVLGRWRVGNDAELRRIRFRERDVALGLLSAAGLYVIFPGGDRMARAIMPKGTQEIGNIYARRSLRPKTEIATRLRDGDRSSGGALLARLRAAAHRRSGAALAYGGVHMVTGNARAHRRGEPSQGSTGATPGDRHEHAALITSHVAWDIWSSCSRPPNPSGSVVQLDGVVPDLFGEPLGAARTVRIRPHEPDHKASQPAKRPMLKPCLPTIIQADYARHGPRARSASEVTDPATVFAAAIAWAARNGPNIGRGPR